MDDDEDTSERRARVSALLAGLRAELGESKRRGAPAATGFRDLVAALEPLLADDDEGPVRRFFGLVNPRPGLPGHTEAKKIEILGRHRELRAQGVWSEDAAMQVGVSARQIARWKNEPAGYAEEIDARLDALSPSGEPEARKDKTSD